MRESFVVSTITDTIFFEDTFYPERSAFLYDARTSIQPATTNKNAILSILNNVGSGRNIQIQSISIRQLHGEMPSFSANTSVKSFFSFKPISTMSGGNSATLFSHDSSIQTPNNLSIVSYPSSTSITDTPIRVFPAVYFKYTTTLSLIEKHYPAQMSESNINATKWFTFSNGHLATHSYGTTPMLRLGLNGTQPYKLRQNEGLGIFLNDALLPYGKYSIHLLISNGTNTFSCDYLMIPIKIEDSNNCIFGILNTDSSNVISIIECSIFEGIDTFRPPQFCTIFTNNHSGGTSLTAASMDSNNTLSPNIEIKKDCLVNSELSGRGLPGFVFTQICDQTTFGINEVWKNTIGQDMFKYQSNNYEIELKEGMGFAIQDRSMTSTGRNEITVQFTTTASQEELCYVS